ncbi:phospholipase D-like domain-containing protein [Halococcus sp. AFM35]|uniref:phospholipase D-like domain-containing protein n=1 Tax=Halococcus sp. AFM35 TaxID=3421653 RepID=UPI003EBF2191
MSELIHHTDESADGGVSPFDTVIREIVAGEDVLLASPYITLDYLEGLVNDTASWRLLTDMEAWLDSCPASERETISEFVAHNHGRIRDVRNLHAKAVIGETGALVGSANLTRTGLGRRDELGVRFDEAERIAELREWFEGLWNESSRAKLDAIDERIRTSSPVSSSAKSSGPTSISSDSRRVNASLTKSEDTTQRTVAADTENEDAHRRLIKRVGKAPNRGWINQHFDLFEELLSVTGLTEDDPILVASIPKSGGIHITINNRYVLTMMRPTRSQTSFILSDDTEDLDELISQTTKHERFSDTNDEPSPHLLAFGDGLERITNPSFKRGWLKAILSEVENSAEKARWRSKHEPVVYRAAINHDYRERVLAEAFGK